MQRKKIKDIDIVCENSGITLAAVADQLPNAGKLSVYKTYGTAMIRVGAFKLEFVGARKKVIKEIFEIQLWRVVVWQMIRSVGTLQSMP